VAILGKEHRELDFDEGVVDLVKTSQGLSGSEFD
jgi:hypothetical protein